MRRLTVPLMAMVLVVAACGDDSAEEAAATEAPAATTASVDEPEPTSAPTTAAAPTTAPPTTPAPTTAAPAGGGGADCLVGAWEMDADKYVAGLASMAAASLPDGDTEATASHVGGTWTFDMNADGTYATDRMDFEIGFDTPDGEMRMVFSGTEAGTWTADGDMLSFAATETTGGVDFFFIVDGVRLPIPSAPFDVDDARGSGTFTCDDTTLEFTPPEGASFSTPLKRR